MIRVNERPATFFLRALPVPSPVIYQMTPRTFDLLLIAASVFTADSLTSRGGTGRSDAGADWYRDLRFVIPVADPEFWRAEHDRLVAVLEFLTGDRFSFAFDRRARREPAQRHLLQDHPPAEAEQVVLFSGGLDSLTGALESLAGEGPRPLLVSHCSATKTIAVQKALYRKLKCRFPGKILWVPADGTLKRVDAKERTQRSRSFLYGALGYAAASLVGANRVSFYENGVVSVNLPFSGQVIGTMATRTTHPLFLSRLGALFSRMAERPITVDNPYAAMTKTEVVTRLRNLDGADLIGKTTSCSSVWTRTRKYPLCGCCSQCLDRRFAILAAGLEAHDPADRYEVDLFLGQRKRELDRTMANDWTRHAGRRLARMSLHQFGTEFAAEIADVVAGYPESQIAHVISEIFEMHRRHGEAVARVVKQTIADEAPRIADGAVPPDTLLAATVTSGVQTAAAQDKSADPDDVPADDHFEGPVFPLRLVYDPDSGPSLRVRGLGEFSGTHYGVVGTLAPYHQQDLQDGRTADEHTCVPAGLLGTSKQAGRLRVKRCRDELAEIYTAVEGTPPESPLLIHTKTSRGYRLDPEARFVGQGPRSG